MHGLHADRTFYLDHDSLLIQIMYTYHASSFGRLLCMSSLIGNTHRVCRFPRVSFVLVMLFSPIQHFATTRFLSRKLKNGNRASSTTHAVNQSWSTLAINTASPLFRHMRQRTLLSTKKTCDNGLRALGKRIEKIPRQYNFGWSCRCTMHEDEGRKDVIDVL
jgi:hypothetical protein